MVSSCQSKKILWIKDMILQTINSASLIILSVDFLFLSVLCEILPRNSVVLLKKVEKWKWPKLWKKEGEFYNNWKLGKMCGEMLYRCLIPKIDQKRATNSLRRERDREHLYEDLQYNRKENCLFYTVWKNTRNLAIFFLLFASKLTSHFSGFWV